MNIDRHSKNARKTTLTNPDGGIGNVNMPPATKDELAYRNGYVQGRGAGEDNQYQRERAAESNGLASGILLGGIAALGIGLGIFVWNYVNQDASSNRQPQSITPATVPASPKPSATPAEPDKQTTVIERTIEKPAPPPEVKIIEVPKPVPVAPATAPSAPVSQPFGSQSPTAPSSTSQPAANQSSSTQPTNRQPSSSQPSSSQPSSSQSTPDGTASSSDGN